MTQKKREVSTSPQWTHQWVALDSIIKHQPWQVRGKLDQKAINRYADMTAAGSVPPPIRLGRVKGRLYLLDGWHRMEAGALKRSSLGEVWVEVADLSQTEAIWEAAQANLGHGVQYSSKDLHAVFKAFIKAKKHIKSNGQLMSYREMSPIIGKPHTTIRAWMLKYFPTVARQYSGDDHGNRDAGPNSVMEIRDEHREVSLQALQAISQRLDLVTPETRWLIARDLEALHSRAVALGILQPPPEDF